MIGNLSNQKINGILMVNEPLYLALYLVAVSVTTHDQLDQKHHSRLLTELGKRLASNTSAECGRMG